MLSIIYNVICGGGQFVREFVLRIWLVTRVLLNSLTLNFNKHKHAFLLPYTRNNYTAALLCPLCIPAKMPLNNLV